MKLKKWIKYVDSLDKVIIWGKHNILFEGWANEVPKKILKYKIGRNDNDDSDDGPIFISMVENEYNVELPTLIINVITKD